MIEGFQLTIMIANGIMCCADCFKVETHTSRRRIWTFYGENENSQKDIINAVMVY